MKLSEAILVAGILSSSAASMGLLAAVLLVDTSSRGMTSAVAVDRAREGDRSGGAIAAPGLNGDRAPAIRRPRRAGRRSTVCNNRCA